MLRIITISTANFLQHTERLLRSLTAVCESFHLTVFCDDTALFRSLMGIGPCTIAELPEIRSLGVKRAKLAAYSAALAVGDFVYMDSDIVVLEDLAGLAGFSTLAGCPDDLSACPFIMDKRHPWLGDPGLVNQIYVNSGILFFPRTLAEFVEDMRRRSLSDEEWERYTVPGRLYDNHFLCAHINRQNLPVHLLDETVYNWQGFRKNGELQVVRHGGSLLNRNSGQKLRLVHFAGIVSIDDLLCSLPVDIASLICERGLGTTQPARAFAQFLASVSPSFAEPLPDPFVRTVFGHLERELLASARSGFRRGSAGSESYFEAVDAMLDLACVVPNSSVEWNGLLCGGAYFEGGEYNYLFRLLREAGIRTALESGAGNTSLLFRRFGVDALSLESNAGPWLDLALAGGCRCRVVPFRDLLFERGPLEAALREWDRSQVDLLLVDSPNGTANRSRVLLQLLEYVDPRFVLFHDAHRDAPNLFRYEAETGLALVDYYASKRGLALFARARDSGLRTRLAAEPPEAAPEMLGVRIEAPQISEAGAGTEISLALTLENRSEHLISSRYSHPFNVGYHWFAQDGTCLVFDGLRTAVPFDLYPGHCAKFPVRIKVPDQCGPIRCQLGLVQEGIRWFHDAGSDSLWLDVNVTPRAAPAATAERPVQRSSPC